MTTRRDFIEKMAGMGAIAMMPRAVTEAGPAPHPHMAGLTALEAVGPSTEPTQIMSIMIDGRCPGGWVARDLAQAIEIPPGERWWLTLQGSAHSGWTKLWRSDAILGPLTLQHVGTGSHPEWVAVTGSTGGKIWTRYGLHGDL